MKIKIEKVKLEDIDSDEKFRVTTNNCIKELLSSIKEDGLITPPLLIFEKNKYLIVSGFRRLSACKKLNVAEINAIVLDEPDELKLHKYAILENSKHRNLNVIEQSIAVTRLLPFFDGADSAKEISKITGIPQNPSLIDKLTQISKLPTRIKNYMLDDSISMVIGLELSNLENRVAIKFADIFHFLKMSLNIQKEVLTNIVEISHREKISLDDIFNTKEIFDILADQDKNRNEIASCFRQYLKKRRYPELSKAEKFYIDKTKTLNLKNIKLIPPKFFEGDNYTISMNFKTTSDLTKYAEEIDSLSQNEIMDEILKREY
ncbi:MAG: ParB/RepB/Spo0J family partition protein [Desulfobacterales bacterium]|nr:ParB/RepB/Spo0J family partition protein [Desulfobacterales bacterium]MCP4161330.1 ParB/RepB/Spo0J family partition protein [Deltaproteobacteria bacterium]